MGMKKQNMNIAKKEKENIKLQLTISIFTTISVVIFGLFLFNRIDHNPIPCSSYNGPIGYIDPVVIGLVTLISLTIATIILIRDFK